LSLVLSFNGFSFVKYTYEIESDYKHELNLIKVSIFKIQRDTHII